MGPDLCSNCNGPIKTLATIVPDGKGGWRHAEKCGAELEGMRVRRPVLPWQEVKV